jgi:hypothetical protein
MVPVYNRTTTAISPPIVKNMINPIIVDHQHGQAHILQQHSQVVV